MTSVIIIIYTIATVDLDAVIVIFVIINITSILIYPNLISYTQFLCISMYSMYF